MLNSLIKFSLLFALGILFPCAIADDNNESSQVSEMLLCQDSDNNHFFVSTDNPVGIIINKDNEAIAMSFVDTEGILHVVPIGQMDVQCKPIEPARNI